MERMGGCWICSYDEIMMIKVMMQGWWCDCDHLKMAID